MSKSYLFGVGLMVRVVWWKEKGCLEGFIPHYEEVGYYRLMMYTRNFHDTKYIVSTNKLLFEIGYMT